MSRGIWKCDWKENDMPEVKIGDYTVVKKLGEGGMGVVFKVVNPRGEHFALKLLRKNSSSGILARFKREIEILRELSSPHIPKIYGIGEYNDKPYFVMEYIEGISLLDYLSGKKRLREKEAVQIMHKVATVIAQTHKLGVIHRDIKPENIMLVDKNPCIMDFGVALQEKDDVRLTKTGTFIGTPNYAPPEQAFGKKKLIGEWTDVYAMGATLYHLVTGVLPFHAESHVQILINIGSQRLPPVRKYNTHVSENAELVIHKAMAKNIKHRYQKAQQFADDLDAILHKKPISITPPSPIVKFIREKWQILVLVSALLAVFAILALP